MQLTPRYLVNNRTTIVTNEAGFITEYRPVYQRQLNVYRGIDNVLDFKVLNADQKPINIAAYTPKFQAFDENNVLILEHDGTLIIGDDDSAASRGLFRITISESNLVNVTNQFLSYNIHLVDNNTNTPLLTYADTNFGMSGNIYVSDTAFPQPRTGLTADTFIGEGDYWRTSTVAAEPGINGNEALHTAAVYTNNYIGDVIVQGTLENQVDEGTDWADVATAAFTGSETEPKAVNFNGVYTFLRFKATADPADKIIKVLVRN
jgi:hypothetical protein